MCWVLKLCLVRVAVSVAADSVELYSLGCMRADNWLLEFSFLLRYSSKRIKTRNWAFRPSKYESSVCYSSAWLVECALRTYRTASVHSIQVSTTRLPEYRTARPKKTIPKSARWSQRWHYISRRRTGIFFQKYVGFAKRAYYTLRFQTRTLILEGA